MHAKPLAVSRQPSARVVREDVPSTAPSPKPPVPRAFTLVEMLVAMAITLVMMAAVVTLFANVSNSVRNRRATTEMAGVLRHVRNSLQQDLQGATCPGVTWQRPDSNHGYIEVVEGPQSDQNPTNIALDPRLSPIPRNNIGADIDGNGKITPQELEAHYRKPESLVPGGLGDHDDVLMLTVRNEHEPFVGRVPNAYPNGTLRDFADWGYETVESTLAEVVWFCIENPSADENDRAGKFFGEPGIRTIYRRALLIAPWRNSYRPSDSYPETFTQGGDSFKAEPGLVRMLPATVKLGDVRLAIAAIIAFQDRYDLSVRLEWDHNILRWKIMANTLADLTKRENRFGHFGFSPANPQRLFPYAFMSMGGGYSANPKVAFEFDPEISVTFNATAEAIVNGGTVVGYSVTDQGAAAQAPTWPRPFAYIADAPGSGGSVATAGAVLNEQGQLMRVTLGPAPLWGARRGQDVMMTDVLGFDLRVYDPGAPLYGRRDVPADTTTPLTVLQPSDPGWRPAANTNLGSFAPGFEFVGQGAYVDMGYAFGVPNLPLPPAQPFTVPIGKSWTLPWFAHPRALSDVYGNQLAPGYAVYDTWSFHYENNGVNDDNDTNAAGQPLIDEGTNGFDDFGVYWNPSTLTYDNDLRLGPDDVGEYETTPPYDKPLRGIQVLIRAYEPDSRAIRQVRVNQHFLPE